MEQAIVAAGVDHDSAGVILLQELPVGGVAIHQVEGFLR